MIMGSAGEILRVEGLTKRFGGLTAVENVDFSLTRGEILGMIGPNGAGKTTIVNMISGNLKPSSGDIRFRSRNITGARPYRMGRMGISRTYQIVKPFPGMSVRDNVSVGAMFGKAGRGISSKEALERTDEIIEFTGLSKYALNTADTLSVASRKRLEMAKVLATGPDVILFDEVMAGLNHKEIDSAVELLEKIRERGISLLVIEHVMRAIRAVSDRLIVIHHGKLIAGGRPEEVLNSEKVIDAYLGKRYGRPDGDKIGTS